MEPVADEGDDLEMFEIVHIGLINLWMHKYKLCFATL